MNTTIKTQNAVESFILNGRANRHLNLEQFRALDDKSKVQWLWNGVVHFKLNVDYKSITPDVYESIFTQVKQAKNPNETPVQLFGRNFTTSAQLMTAVAYGERFNAPVRNLDFNVQCDNFNDLVSCVLIIDSYNEFNSSTICRALNTYADRPAFYGETNPNNDNDLFKFHIAREGSPAFYVTFSILNSISKPRTIVSRNGAEVTFREYTMDDFKNDMTALASACLADSFKITPSEMHGLTMATARFWFD